MQRINGPGLHTYPTKGYYLLYCSIRLQYTQRNTRSDHNIESPYAGVNLDPSDALNDVSLGLQCKYIVNTTENKPEAEWWIFSRSSIDRRSD